MGLSPSAATLALSAALAGVTTARLHTGHPGSSGTANVLGSGDNTTVAFGSPVNGEAETGSAVWTAPTGTGSVTDVSLWAGAAYRGNAQVVGGRPVTTGVPFVLDRIVMAVVPS